MRQETTVAMVDHLEMILGKAFASKNPVSIGERDENAIPLRFLQLLEKYVAGWKSSGLPRQQMEKCFSNPLVREAVIGGLVLDSADVDRLQDEWMKILRRHQLLRRHKNVQEFIDRL